uniref:carbohydrate ABC transporter permease n=1 Tax=Marinobacterium profundum TaxID=1714300 RepID=UPI0009E7B526|nr:carbohydrate ABC transporter permease [Marinobacterium profundum]
MSANQVVAGDVTSIKKSTGRSIISLSTRERINRAFIYLGLIISSAVVGFPVYWMISVSLRPNHETFALPPKLIPDNISFDAYFKVFRDDAFITYFVNSYMLGIIVTILSVILGTLVAYSFTRYRFFGDGIAKTFVITTQMVPAITLLIPYFGVIVLLGLYDTTAGLILTYLSFSLPYCIVMMTGYLKTIPKDFDEAAIIDGCSRIKVLYKIIMPLALPGMASTAIYTFLLSWNEFLFALALTRSEDMRTLPVGISMFIGEHSLKWDEMMALSALGSIPVIIMFIVLQRYFVSGLSTGGVKG